MAEGGLCVYVPRLRNSYCVANANQQLCSGSKGLVNRRRLGEAQIEGSLAEIGPLALRRHSAATRNSRRHSRFSK